MSSRPDSVSSTVVRRLRRRTWLLPVVGAVLFAIAAWWVTGAVESRLRTQVQETLVTIRDANVAAVSLWMDEEMRVLGTLVRSDGVRAAVVAALSDGDSRALRGMLADGLAPVPVAGSLLLEPSGAIRPVDSAGETPASGVSELMVADGSFVRRVLAEGPSLSKVTMAGPPDSPPATFVWIGAPVELPGGTAGIVVRSSLGRAFDAVLRTARLGESGETYVVATGGAIISASRFTDQLASLGLGGEDGSRLEARNPGVNLLSGLASPLPRGQQPLTRAAAAGLAGDSGYDIDGYRDYRGVPVVGAWSWIPELGVVIVSELDVEEAFSTVRFIRQVNAGVIGLLLAAAVAMIYHGQVVARMGEHIAESRRLGRYVLEDKIGEGGMGAVYRARHAMLRRPTAVKLIRPVGDAKMMQERFEREVQAVAGLSHPNTVAVYDYGRTRDGVFYYAMEFLEGMSFRDLVELDGPQPAGRVARLLIQACGSLEEAHARGLVHRDIKPGNLMVCRAGGIPDFVKVLDFGLVRELESRAELTADHVVGTPEYMSPEAIESPAAIDARSDIYQLGLVAYYLLTGTRPFDGSALAVMGEHLRSQPDPPSQRSEMTIPSELEAIVMRCLEKEPARRYASAEDLASALDAVAEADEWSAERARRWWAVHVHRATPGTDASTTLLEVELEER